ncbi:hypothetical protein HK100_003425 [Physocladia obscura]|uniref:Attractin/MKLN-like beta-propeller domain-containing protein n=1 Tax=Physocladia obscura TaxID=109957 RepID=A0AAD5SWQ1_9FUNG|nr:hypothetical protein HK100_003425 [Physocladia obscura]
MQNTKETSTTISNSKWLVKSAPSPNSVSLAQSPVVGSWFLPETFVSIDAIQTSKQSTHYKPPAPRVGASLVYFNSTAYLFAGASHEDGYFNSIHALNLESRVWKAIKPRSKFKPIARYDHLSLIVDQRLRQTDSKQMLVFGGAADDGLLNDLWLYSFEFEEWIQIEAKGVMPSPRTIQSCGYAKTLESEKIFIFGGGAGGDEPIPDSHVYCLNVKSMLWSHFKNLGSENPPPLHGHSTVLVTKNGRDMLVVFGGMYGTNHMLLQADKTEITSSNVWILDLQSKLWTCFSASSCGYESENPWPKSRSGHTLTVVNHRKLTKSITCCILTGGMHRSSNTIQGVKVLDDVWLLYIDDTDNVKIFWKCLEPMDEIVGNKETGAGYTGGIDASVCSIPADSAITGMIEIEANVSAVSAAAENLCLQVDISSKKTGLNESKPDEALLLFGGMDLRSVNNTVRVLKF